jgi:hypothetical protein
VKFHLNRFLRRVRIHGGEFDTSARAMYRDEVVYPLQAELRIVRGSTIERKQMSTKTTFKRVALVTVAALGFGTMAAIAPATAATGATTISLADVTAQGFVGETITAKIVATATGAGALEAGDSFTVSAVLASTSSTNAATIESTTVDSATTKVELSVNRFRLAESVTVSNVLVLSTTNHSSNQLKAAFGSATETGTAYQIGSVQFRPTTPGTYTIAVGIDSQTAGAAASTVYRGATVTFNVLSAGANTGDGFASANTALRSYLAANGVAGVGNYNQIKLTGQSGTVALGTRAVISGSTWAGLPTASVQGTVTGMTLSDDKTTLFIPGATSGTANQVLANALTPAAGTVTVTTTRETAVGTFSTTAAHTVTLTVRATALTGVVASTTAYMTSVTTAAADATTDAAVVLSAPKAAAASSVTALARIDVTQLDALEAAASTSKTQAVTAEISGAGRIGKTEPTATAFVSVAAGTSTTAGEASSTFYVYPDGRPGTGTIVIKINGVVALTRTVSFFGAATSLKLVAATAAVPNPTKSYLAVGGTMTISVLPYDANNIKLSATSVTATSETATVATVLSTSYAGGVVTVTGVAAGKTNITITSGLVSLVVPVEVTKSTGIAKLTLDKTTAEPGEKITWTITATDANGRPVADGTSIALFSSVTANMSVTGLPTGSETLTAGTSTGSFFAPTSGSGTLTITAKQGTAQDTYIAGLKAATAAGTTYTAVSDVISVTIVNAAVDAAAAAAEEATAAANDATDAALSAAEAAEAATAMAQEAVDAVAELSSQVTALISALRAQITSLTNLVIKIQKKVKA